MPKGVFKKRSICLPGMSKKYAIHRIDLRTCRLPNSVYKGIREGRICEWCLYFGHKSKDCPSVAGLIG